MANNGIVISFLLPLEETTSRHVNEHGRTLQPSSARSTSSGIIRTPLSPSLPPSRLLFITGKCSVVQARRAACRSAGQGGSRQRNAATRSARMAVSDAQHRHARMARMEHNNSTTNAPPPTTGISTSKGQMPNCTLQRPLNRPARNVHRTTETHNEKIADNESIFLYSGASLRVGAAIARRQPIATQQPATNAGEGVKRAGTGGVWRW